MTYLYETCTVNDAIDRARKLGRLSTPDTPSNFTPSAIEALFEYLEQLAKDTASPIELDIIAWCCDWSEHSSFWEAYEDQFADPSDLADYDEDMDEDEREDCAREFFNENSQIIEFPGGVLIAAF